MIHLIVPWKWLIFFNSHLRLRFIYSSPGMLAISCFFSSIFSITASLCGLPPLWSPSNLHLGKSLLKRQKYTDNSHFRPHSSYHFPRYDCEPICVPFAHIMQSGMEQVMDACPKKPQNGGKALYCVKMKLLDSLHLTSWGQDTTR